MNNQEKEEEQSNSKNQRDNEKIPQRKSVFLIWLFSFLTLGIYMAIWYMKRKPEFDNLKTQKKLNKKIVTIYLVILIVSAIYQIMENWLEIIPESFTTFLSFSLIIFAILLITFHLILAFNTRTIINQAWQSKKVNRKVSWFFTLIFSIFYLQYEINRTIDNKENEKRIGPWIFFIILLMSPLLLLLFFVIKLLSVIGIDA